MSDNFYELIKKSIDLLIKKDFDEKLQSYAFYIPETKNEAFMDIEKSATREGCFRFWISVRRTGSDYEARYCMTNDKAEDELKEYLKSEYLEKKENIKNLQTAIMELSKIINNNEGEFPFDY